MTSGEFKIRLKGHESFYIREGWLIKGIDAIHKDPNILSSSSAIDELGVGANMVKSIRYWLPAVGLTEIKCDKNKRVQIVSENFGEIILQKDKFLEDKFSLALLHYNLATNKELATSWYLFFNKVSKNEISKSKLSFIMEEKLKSMNSNLKFSLQSLNDDCSCIIKTYTYDDEDLKNPEDNLICPLSELGLLKKVYKNGSEEFILKATPNMKNLDKLAVLYVIVDQLEGSTLATNINKLLEDECNVGKVFNLDKNSLEQYIDELEADDYLTINKTAGLNTIYINPINKVDILNKYYGN